jgi:hypothetical protein
MPPDSEILVERLIQGFENQLWAEDRCILDPESRETLRQAIQKLVLHKIPEVSPEELAVLRHYSLDQKR